MKPARKGPTSAQKPAGAPKKRLLGRARALKKPLLIGLGAMVGTVVAAAAVLLVGYGRRRGSEAPNAVELSWPEGAGRAWSLVSACSAASRARSSTA